MLTQERVKEEARIQRKTFIYETLAMGLWVFACIFIALILCAWFNLI